MQNRNYRSVPIQEFQPIEVQLESDKESKEVDFKLFVLLILIVFLGVLINQYEQQLELQTKYAIELTKAQYSNNMPKDNVQRKSGIPTRLEIEENQQSLSLQKQLYSQNTQIQIDKSSEEQQSKNPQLLSNSTKPSLQLANSNLSTVGNEQLEKQKEQVQRLYKASLTFESNEKSKLRMHKNLLKKYVQFYFWFPFFIFALIIYSCYQKQYTQSSIFISVKKINDNEFQNIVEQCAICITDIKGDDLLSVLPCSKKHVFHSQCIKEWLDVKKTCPICRSDVRKFRKLGK